MRRMSSVLFQPSIWSSSRSVTRSRYSFQTRASSLVSSPNLLAQHQGCSGQAIPKKGRRTDQEDIAFRTQCMKLGLLLGIALDGILDEHSLRQTKLAYRTFQLHFEGINISFTSPAPRISLMMFRRRV